MVGADSRGVPRAPRYLGSHPKNDKRSSAYGALTLCGRTFQSSSVHLLPFLLFKPKTLPFFRSLPQKRKDPQRKESESSSVGPATPAGKPTGLGSSAFARRYLRNLFDFFSSGYLDVSVHRLTPKHPMYSDVGDGPSTRRVSPFGYPRINTSVQLPEAFRRLRVLLRQLVPRHSSCTLSSFYRRPSPKSLPMKNKPQNHFAPSFRN